MKVALDQTKKDIKTFSTSAISRLGGIAKIASGALVTGFIASAKSALQYGKELDNLANLSGATFDEFQRLTLGAKTVGIENQKLGDIFKDVNDKLGDFAQTGGGPMADFFDYIGPAIGVTIKDFQKLSGPEALQFYYDSLKKVNLSQQDMIFFMEAVASDASALIPLLDNGGKAWEEYAQKMVDAGLMLDEEMIEKLKNAEVRLDILNKKTKVFTVEMLDAYVLFGAGFKQTWKEIDNILYGAGDVLAGTLKLDTKQYQDGWNQIIDIAKNGWQRIKDAIKDEDPWRPVIEGIADMPAVSQEVVDQLKAMGIEAVATLSVEQIKAMKANRDLRIKTEQDIAKVRAKIGVEQDKRAAKEMTAQEQYAAAIQDRVQKQAELAQLQSTQASDDVSNALVKKAITDKQLEVEQALTKESENQVKFGKEQVDIAKTEFEKQKALLNTEILLASAAGDTVKARDLKQQLSDMEEIKDIVAKTTLNEDEAAVIVKRKNNMLKEQKELQTQLEIAQGLGDQKKVAALKREIAKRDEIKALIDSTNLSEAEAEAIIDAKNALLDKQKALQLEVIKAEADGNDHLARELQKRIDKQAEAQSLMDDFNMSLDDAVALAEKLAAVRAGPDLNQSGFTTPKEQRAFDRQQKERQKAQDKINDQELRDERQRGRSIPNVSDTRRRTGTIAERMAESKEKAARINANRAINKEGDAGKRKAMIEAENVRRAAVAKTNAEKFGGDQVDKPMTNLERQAAKNKALQDRREAEEKAKNQPLGPDGKPVGPGGNHVGPDGKMVGPNGQPLGPNGQPLDPNGKPVPDGPKQPGGGQDPSLEKLDKIIAELQTANKSLTC